MTTKVRNRAIKALFSRLNRNGTEGGVLYQQILNTGKSKRNSLPNGSANPHAITQSAYAHE